MCSDTAAAREVHGLGAHATWARRYGVTTHSLVSRPGWQDGCCDILLGVAT